jgi:hypothetical protein
VLSWSCCWGLFDTSFHAELQCYVFQLLKGFCCLSSVVLSMYTWGSSADFIGDLYGGYHLSPSSLGTRCNILYCDTDDVIILVSQLFFMGICLKHSVNTYSPLQNFNNCGSRFSCFIFGYNCCIILLNLLAWKKYCQYVCIIAENFNNVQFQIDCMILPLHEISWKMCSCMHRISSNMHC